MAAEATIEPDFREQIRRFVDHNLPLEWRDAVHGASSDEDVARIRQEWGRRLHAGGWGAPTLGPANGGLALSGADLLIYLEELYLAGAPEPANSNAIGILAPVLEAFATPAQCARNLPSMLSHDVLWCQGFSEPDAGSDLAHLRTRAVSAEGGWLISGQKVWTTNAIHADRCYLLARTDPDAEAHQGISLFLLDVHQPGVEVRTIRTITDTHEFCEVFLDNAFVRADDLVGEPGDGWRLATFALEHERASLLGQRALRMSRELDAAYRLLGADGAVGVQRELGRVHAAVRATEAVVRRNLTLLGAKQSPGVLSSVAKLQWSETHQRLLDLVADARGPEHFTCEQDRHWAQALLHSRAETIYAGTSEIQRNLIARAVGLPGSRR